MKKLLTIYLIILILTLSACANQIETEIPDTISVTGEPVITVRHEFVISLEMEELFKDQCAADNQGASQEVLDACYAKKAGDFLNQMMELLNSQQGAQK